MGWGHTLGVGTAALALLAVGSQVQSWLPTEEDDPGSQPHVRAGGIGDELDLRTARLTARSVTASRRLVEFGSEMVTPGVWLLVRYTVTAEQENTAITYLELEHEDGRLWTLSGRNSNLCTGSPPGVPTHCAAYFEVPVEAVPDLTLRVARLAGDTRYDALGEVDLGLTAADLAGYEYAAPIEVPAPTVGGGGP